MIWPCWYVSASGPCDQLPPLASVIPAESFSTSLQVRADIAEAILGVFGKPGHQGPYYGPVLFGLLIVLVLYGAWWHLAACLRAQALADARRERDAAADAYDGDAQLLSDTERRYPRAS